MDKQYITKTDLDTRWSNSLIEKYYPQCSEERINPHYRYGSPMQLYDVGKIRYIESRDDFKADYEKVLKRKIIALERARKKREELMMYANGVQIVIPEFEKNKLIQKACEDYNWRHIRIDEDDYCRASPSSNELFLKRIAINYLRHQCTCYEEELRKFQKKIGIHEAHDILQARINEAIKQKYEWLR